MISDPVSVISVVMSFFHYVELADASSDEEYHCYSPKPPCEGYAYCEAGNHEENTTDCIEGDG